MHGAWQGAKEGEASADPSGSAGAEKRAERSPGDRQTMASRPGSSRRSRDAARTPEPTLTAIDEDRILGAVRGQTPPKAKRSKFLSKRARPRRQCVRPTTIVNPPARFCVRFRLDTIGVRRFSPLACSVSWVVLSLGYFIANRAVLFMFRPGPCCLRQHSPS